MYNKEKVQMILNILNCSVDVHKVMELLPDQYDDMHVLQNNVKRALTELGEQNYFQYDNEDLVDTLLRERNSIPDNSLYFTTLSEMTYHSNAIDGSEINQKQIEEAIKYNHVHSSCRIPELEEMQGHFFMFNYMIDTLAEPLNSWLIREFHRELKQGSSSDRRAGFAIGDYKKEDSSVQYSETVSPAAVSHRMERLLSSYHCERYPTLEQIVEMHFTFEKIHPFQSGNGRVGRLILFRECLLNGIPVFIIPTTMRNQYFQCVRENDVKTMCGMIKHWQMHYAMKINGKLKRS